MLIFFLFRYTGARTQNNTINSWKVKDKASLYVNQSYHSNWSAGSESNFDLIGKHPIILDYDKEKYFGHNWLGLGCNVIGKKWLAKADEIIEFISAYKWQHSKYWFYTVVGSFKSQFANGYDYAETIIAHTTKSRAQFGTGLLLVPGMV